MGWREKAKPVNGLLGVASLFADTQQATHNAQRLYALATLHTKDKKKRETFVSLLLYPEPLPWNVCMPRSKID